MDATEFLRKTKEYLIWEMRSYEQSKMKALKQIMNGSLNEASKTINNMMKNIGEIESSRCALERAGVNYYDIPHLKE